MAINYSDNIDFLATSLLIVDIHTLESEEWIRLSKENRIDEYINKRNTK